MASAWSHCCSGWRAPSSLPCRAASRSSPPIIPGTGTSAATPSIPTRPTTIASWSANEVRADFAFEINLVPGTQPTVPITFTAFANQSDPGPGFGSPPGGAATGNYKFPPGARLEGGSDAHGIVVDTDNKILYETYQTSGGPPWSAACGAVFDLNSNALRPLNWTSADAAGLPIFTGLLRYDEITAGAIRHALRVTVPSTQNAYLYPARHEAGSASVNLPPMGLRLRLKSTFDTSGYTGAARVALDALKRYGLMVADNGSAWYVSTTVDPAWGSSNINSPTAGLRSLLGSDLEAVLTVDGSGNPIPPSGLPGGGGGGGGCGATGLEALLLLGLLRRLIRGSSPGPTSRKAPRPASSSGRTASHS